MTNLNTFQEFTEWDWFLEQTWQEHKTEKQAWEGKFPTYTKEEYIKKNYNFLKEKFTKH
jgi:hypothetical protein